MDGKHNRDVVKVSVYLADEKKKMNKFSYLLPNFCYNHPNNVKLMIVAQKYIFLILV